MSRRTNAAAALNSRQQKAQTTGNTITYTRVSGGPDVDLTNKAWDGSTAFRRIGVSDVGAAAVVFGDRDYLIPAADLGFEPERGDRITETINGTPTVYEIVAPLDEPDWRWSDSGETRYRVHTKKQT